MKGIEIFTLLIITCPIGQSRFCKPIDDEGYLGFMEISGIFPLVRIALVLFRTSNYPSDSHERFYF